jgi:hypothetical protein
MTTTSLQGVSWLDVPHHPVKRAGAILGVSGSQVYKFVKEGQLQIVKSAGKSQITTDSMRALQAKAKPWTPDAARLAKANAARLKARRVIV